RAFLPHVPPTWVCAVPAGLCGLGAGAGVWAAAIVAAVTTAAPRVIARLNISSILPDLTIVLPGRGELFPSLRVLQSRIPNPHPSIPYPESSILNPQSLIPNQGSLIHDHQS